MIQIERCDAGCSRVLEWLPTIVGGEELLVLDPGTYRAKFIRTGRAPAAFEGFDLEVSCLSGAAICD